MKNTNITIVIFLDFYNFFIFCLFIYLFIYCYRSFFLVVISFQSSFFLIVINSPFLFLPLLSFSPPLFYNYIRLLGSLVFHCLLFQVPLIIHCFQSSLNWMLVWSVQSSHILVKMFHSVRMCIACSHRNACGCFCLSCCSLYLVFLCYVKYSLLFYDLTIHAILHWFIYVLMIIHDLIIVVCIFKLEPFLLHISRICYWQNDWQIL